MATPHGRIPGSECPTCEGTGKMPSTTNIQTGMVTRHSCRACGGDGKADHAPQRWEMYLGHAEAIAFDAHRDHVRAALEKLDRARGKVLRSGMTVANLIDALSALPPGAFVLQADAGSNALVRSVRVRGEFVELSEETEL